MSHSSNHRGLDEGEDGEGFRLAGRRKGQRGMASKVTRPELLGLGMLGSFQEARAGVLRGPPHQSAARTYEEELASCDHRRLCEESDEKIPGAPPESH